MEPLEVVIAFNDAINARDLDGLAALMSDDHRFIDSDGATVAGKSECVEAWRGFFAAFPDYCNDFAEMCEIEPGSVSIRGRSTCSVPELDGPARWTATVLGDCVTSWQVGEDAGEGRGG